MPPRSHQCERARELVSRSVDTELSQLEDALLRAHQSRCAECRDFSSSVRWFTRALRAAAQEEPGRPVSLPRRRAVLHGARFAAVAAAVAAVAGAASMLTMLGTPDTQRRTPEVRTRSLSPGDLAELRSLRRDELVYTSSIISPRANDERILRLS